MKQAHYDRLITRLDGFSRDFPRLYVVTVWLLAMLGYAYLGAIVVLLCAALASLAWGMIHCGSAMRSPIYAKPMLEVGIPVGLALIIMIWEIVRSLFITIPAPTGDVVERHQAPRLYGMIDDVAGKLKTSKIHQVLISPEFTVGVCQVPKLGIIGFQQSYLELGLPLMQSVSPEEFRAIIAHELGHVSRNHSVFSGWIYRQRTTWMVLLQSFKKHLLLYPFFQWYAPYFQAYTFVFARANEYVADQCSAEVSTAVVACRALLTINVKAYYLHEDFWPSVLKRSDTEPQPNVAPFVEMTEALAKGASPEDTELYVQEALSRKPTNQDCHPAPYQRLGALGFRIVPGSSLDPIKCPVPIPEPLGQSAATFYLGGFAQKYAQKLDKRWREAVHREWVEHHKQAQWDRSAWHSFTQRATGERLSYDDMWKLATLTGRFAGDDAAVPILRRLLQAQPGHFDATATLGVLLAQSGNREGLSLLQNAKLMRPHLAESIQTSIVRYTRRCGSPVAPAGGSARPVAAERAQSRQ